MYALKLELKLNNNERSLLKGCAGFKRMVYNFGLSLVKDSWSLGIKGSDSRKIEAAKKMLTNDLMKQDQYRWMKSYPSTVYQSAFKDLKDAFERWRKGKTEIPVFKAKKKGDSFTVYKTSGVYLEKGKAAIPFSNRQVLYPGKKITLPGLGTFRLKEAIPFICSSQTFTISRKADRWFVSFIIDAERVPPIIHEHEAVGIDLGIKTFATLSDGTTYDSPKPMKKAKIKLGKLQWRNRRKQLGNSKKGIYASLNAHKFYMKQAKLHLKIANQRRDFLQKTTTKISKKYYRIRIEDLNVSGMLANGKLSAAISDLGFYEFRRQLEYKQYHYGTRVELVDQWFPSSKQCLYCQTINKELKLSDRVFKCINPECGLEQDRDYHASLNLLNAPNEVVRSARP
jgi:putative transposase